MNPDILKKINPNFEEFALAAIDDKSFFIESNTTLDEIYEGDSVRALRMMLNNRIAKKLVKKLSDDIEVEYALFAPKDDELVRGITKGKKALYLPFLLVFKDGQVLQAYGKNKVNKSNKKTINYSKETHITNWYLNGVEVTKAIGYTEEQSDSELITKLSSLINRTHEKFIKKDKDVKDFEKEKKLLLDEINKIIKEYNDGLSNSKRIKELQAQYNPNESLLGTNAVAGGENQAEKVRERNQKIREELKELGGEIPEDVKIELPESKPQKELLPLYKIILPIETTKYIKALKQAFKETFTSVRFKFFGDNKSGIPREFGGLGGIRLDAINESDIQIEGEDDFVIKQMTKLIIEVTSNEDFKEIQALGDKKGLLLSFKSDLTVTISVDGGKDVLEEGMSLNDAEEFVGEYVLERFSAGHMGGVDITMWDRTKKENGDYKRVGIIDKGHAELEEGYQNDDEAIEFSKKHGAKTFEHEKVKLTPQINDQELVSEIKNNEVYKQLMKDSFNGVMYQPANADKYDSSEILKLWEQVEHKDSQDGIIKGAMSFLIENRFSELNSKENHDFNSDLTEFITLTDSESDLDRADEILEKLETQMEVSPSDELDEIFNKMNQHLNTLI